jgi:hypothetical protein
VTLLVFGGIYFYRIVQMMTGAPGRGDVFLFLSLVSALVVVEVALHIALAIQSPKEARTPRDERERLIDLKATRVAFYVLVVGAFASIGTVHLRAGRWEMMQATLLAIVIAELSKFGSQIVLYRRDA